MFFEYRKLSGLLGFLFSFLLLCFGLSGALLLHLDVCCFGLLDALGELLEPVDTAASINELLLARVERMTLGADFSVDYLVRRACDKFVAADASDLDFVVICRVDAGFHRGSREICKAESTMRPEN